MQKEPIENDIPKYRKVRKKKKYFSMSKKHLEDLFFARLDELEKDIQMLIRYENSERIPYDTFVYFFIDSSIKECDDIIEIMDAMLKWK